MKQILKKFNPPAGEQEEKMDELTKLEKINEALQLIVVCFAITTLIFISWYFNKQIYDYRKGETYVIGKKEKIAT